MEQLQEMLQLQSDYLAFLPEGASSVEQRPPSRQRKSAVTYRFTAEREFDCVWEVLQVSRMVRFIPTFLKHSSHECENYFRFVPSFNHFLCTVNCPTLTFRYW
jgi:hypothetical protein